jgi:hypothetical protein
MSLPIERRLIAHIVGTNEKGCWLCSYGNVGKTGHRQMSVHGKRKLCHRVAYELWIGPIPEGKYLIHSCDVSNCIFPLHLIVGDQFLNMQHYFWGVLRAPLPTFQLDPELLKVVERRLKLNRIDPTEIGLVL